MRGSGGAGFGGRSDEALDDLPPEPDDMDDDMDDEVSSEADEPSGGRAASGPTEQIETASGPTDRVASRVSRAMMPLRISW